MQPIPSICNSNFHHVITFFETVIHLLFYNKSKCTSTSSDYCHKYDVIKIFEFEGINSRNNKNTNKKHFY